MIKFIIGFVLGYIFAHLLFYVTQIAIPQMKLRAWYKETSK